MVDFITVNQWGLPVMDGQFSRSFEHVGARFRLFGGRVSESRRHHKQTYALTTPALTRAEATAVRGLLHGYGNRWDFAAGIYSSSKGHGPEVGHNGTTGSTVGYGGGYGLTVASGGAFALKTVVSDVHWTGEWTFIAHFGENGLVTTAADRILFRDNDTVGDGYLNGVAGTYGFDDCVDFSNVSANGFVLQGEARNGGGTTATYWDNIVILPYRVTDEMALAFSAQDNEFSALPELVVRLADEDTLLSAERTMLGDVTRSTYTQGSTGGTWQMNLQQLEITLEESEQVDIPNPLVPPAQSGIALWYDAELAVGAGDVPVNLGYYAAPAMVAVGGVQLTTATIGATANAPVWDQTATGGHYDSDQGLGTSNDLLNQSGDDMTVAAVIIPNGWQAGANIQPFFTMQRSNAGTAAMWFSKQHPTAVSSVWHPRYDAGTLPNPYAGDITSAWVVVGTGENVQVSGGGNETVYARKLASGSSWLNGTPTVAADRIRSRHHLMGSAGVINFSVLAVVMLWPSTLLSAAQRDELYDYFVDRFGEA